MYNIDLSIDNQSNTTELPQEEDPPSWVSTCLNLKQVQDALHDRPIAFSLVYLNRHDAQDLNFKYRHKNYATNILSFPAEIPDFITSINDGFTLGDLVLCPEVILQEAKEHNKKIIDHFAHLIIHGFLHLLGFNHMTDQTADIMEAIEIETLAQLGIANPYYNALSPDSHSNPSNSDAAQGFQISTPQLETL